MLLHIQPLLMITLIHVILAQYYSPEPVDLCYPLPNQVFTANNSGVLSYKAPNAQHNTTCGLVLDGFRGSTIVIANLQNLTCSGLTINGHIYCAAPSFSTIPQKIMRFNRINAINLRGLNQSFLLHYYKAQQFCSESSNVTISKDVAGGLRGLILPTDTDNRTCRSVIQNPMNFLINLTAQYTRHESRSFGEENGGRYARIALSNEDNSSNTILTNKSVIELHSFDERHVGVKDVENDGHLFPYYDSLSSLFHITYTAIVCTVGPPNITNGNFTDLPLQPWHVGMTVYYGCNEGYTFRSPFAGNMTICSWDEQRKNSFWTATEHIQCIPVDRCLAPPPAADRKIYNLSSNNLTAIFNCENGFFSSIENQTELWNCSSPNPDRDPWRWSRSGGMLNCVPVPCLDPPSIEHGKPLPGSHTGNYSTFVYLNTVQYGCSEGFLLQGEAAECQSDGTWSSAPICVSAESGITEIQVVIISVSTGVAILMAITFTLIALKWRRGRNRSTVRTDPSKVDAQPMNSAPLAAVQTMSNSAGYIDVAELNDTHIPLYENRDTMARLSNRGNKTAAAYESLAVSASKEHDYQQVTQETKHIYEPMPF